MQHTDEFFIDRPARLPEFLFSPLSALLFFYSANLAGDADFCHCIADFVMLDHAL